MEQNNRYRQPPASGTGEEIRQFLRQRKRVPVNTGLIILNLLVFLGVEGTGSALDTNHMLRWGAMYAPDIFQQGEYYRLITSMFLHFGIQHLGNNMLVILFLGDCLERNVGKVRYFLCWEDLEPTVFLYGWNCRMENISFLQERQAQYLPLLAHSSMWCLSIKEKLKILRQGSFCLWQR